MGLIQDFRDFAVQGNAVDLAVGVIIGGAFGKIVNSIVADIIMPPIGLAIGGVNFTSLRFVLQAASTDAAGKAIPEVAITYGNFLQTTFDFLIVAFCIFMVVRGINSLRKPKVEEAVAAPAQEEVLLTEIRDLLKTRG